ncbi:MAG: ABC transporter ATP-binding protein [Candidatus Limnocylindrales bacterium]
MLEATDLVIRRGTRVVMRAGAFSVAEGEHLAVLGPNGAGKSSLILALAALLPMSGELRYRGSVVTDAQAFRRRVGVVFQRPLLLGRSVRENVGLGLAIRGVSRVVRNKRAETELARLGVAHLADRSASRLSGGESQRVSIARALATDPEILFLDEPFSALDAPTREALIADLARVLRDRGTTAVMVTHDRDEALSLADRIAVVMNGELRQQGTAEAVFGMPADPEIAAFVGVENVIPAKVEGSTDELTALRISDQLIEVTALPPPGDDFPLLCVRPDDVIIARIATASSARNSLAARIVRIEPIGRRTRLVLDCGFPLIAHVTRQSAREMELVVGDRVVASFKATVPHLLPRHRARRPRSS